MFRTHPLHSRTFLGALMLALTAVGCSLAGTPPTAMPAPTATLVPPDGQMAVVQVVVTPTPNPVVVAPVATAYIPPETAYVPLTVALPANCQVQTGWQPYTVQAGDTLGVLAIATNIALSDLIIGNCLANPDVITVGQTVYLPGAMLASPAPISTPAPGVAAPQIGNVLVEPAFVNNGAYMVAPGVLTLRAQGVDHTASVTFYMSIIGTSAPPTVLGTDTNLADGVVLVWQLGPAPFRANVWATATGTGNITASTNPILVVNNG